MSGADWADGFFGTGPAPEEGSADMRAIARNLRDAFMSFRSEGFTDEQAMALTQTWCSSMILRTREQ